LDSDDREDSRNLDSRLGSRQSDKDKELLALSFNKENKLFTYLDTDFTNDDLEKSERSNRQKSSLDSKSRERNNSSKGSSLDQRDPSSEHDILINPADQINTIDVYEKIDFSPQEDISSKRKSSKEQLRKSSKEQLKKNDSNSGKKRSKGLLSKALG